MFEIFKKNEGQVINVNEIDNLLGKIELIDIREPYEYKEGSIKTAKKYTYEYISKWCRKVSK